jgi:hypothetical protein
MIHPTDITTKHPDATRSTEEFDPPLLEIFWGKGEEGKALYRAWQQELQANRPAKVRQVAPRKPRKPRQSSPGGLKTAAQAAAKLNCSIKTLRAHVAAGDLRYVSLGKGRKRSRRMFANSDINEFITNQTRKDVPCPSTRTRGRRTGNTDSKSEIVSFSEAQRRRRSVRPKR